MWHPESIFDAGGHLDEGVVHAWLDGQLAPDAATHVEAHAAACGACSAMVAEARGLIAGASRVMASLDEPAVGQGPARDAMIGIVAAAGAAQRPGGVRLGGETGHTDAPASDDAPSRTDAQRARATAPRWSVRRISYAAAAAFVLVAAALVLRDSGSVRDMVQAEQQASAELGEGSTPGATTVAPEAASAPAVTPPSASAPEGAQAVVQSPAADAASAPRNPRRTGSTAGSVASEPGYAFRRPATTAAPEPDRASPPPAAATDSARERVEASSPPPAPAPAPAASPATSSPRSRTVDEVVVTGIAGGRAMSNQAGKAAEAAAVRDAESRAAAERAADSPHQLSGSEAQPPQVLAGEARAGTVRSSAEIQAMVRMVSSCWRVADGDSVVELLPPGNPSAVPSGLSAGWIPGWLRVGRDDTNPERIWWLPLADSVSARVRLGGVASEDLVITPRAGSVQLRRVPRTDTLETWASIPRGALAESAAGVRCVFP